MRDLIQTDEVRPLQTVFSSPARYTQGPDSIEQLPSEMALLGLSGPVLIVSGPTMTRQLESQWQRILGSVGIPYRMHLFPGECSIAAIDEVRELAERTGAATLLAAGGGKVLDTTRSAAAALGRPFIAFPTVASTDSPCSAISVIYDHRGIMTPSTVSHAIPTWFWSTPKSLSKVLAAILLPEWGTVFRRYLRRGRAYGEREKIYEEASPRSPPVTWGKSVIAR